MLVGDIMHRDLTSLAEETTLLEALSLLAAHDTSGLPVLNQSGKVVGFLSEKDILRAVIPGYLGYMDENFSMPDIAKIKSRVNRVGMDPAKNYMSKDAVIFDEKETVSNAIVMLFKKNVRRAPVVRDGSLVGMIDREKILRGFVHENFEDGEVDIPVGGVSL
ncbi:MAG: CBS domain-containing protein [Synergistaceae bacterium]|jgi:CBS domain-containing protein|nr:CBS domain-containing protein [Synergistaceae bacterium]